MLTGYPTEGKPAAGARRIAWPALLVAALALVVAGCGGDDDEVAEPEPTVTEPTLPEPAPPPDDEDDENDEDEVEPGAWEELPEAPIASRLNASVTWANGHVVVWGGGDAGTVAADGAAWNAASEEWEPIPEAPISARWGHEGFSVGPGVLVWGGTAGPDHLAECYTDGAI
jgi:hypothetical protein